MIEIDKYRDIIIAGLEYYDKHVFNSPNTIKDKNLIALKEQFRTSSDDLKKRTLELHQISKLPTLKRWFRDISEIAIATNDLNYQHYIEAATGYKLDVFGKLFNKVDRIITAGEIKSEAQFRTIASMIDYLESHNPPDENRISTLITLQSAYLTRK